MDFYHVYTPYPQGWQVSGRFGVVQFLAQPMGQAEVAALAWRWGAEGAGGAGGDEAGGGAEVRVVGSAGAGSVAAAAVGDVNLAPTAEERKDLALVLVAMSNACKRLAERLAAAPLRAGDSLGYAAGGNDGEGGTNASGDVQKKLDVVANELVREALASCGAVRWGSDY